MDISYHPSTQLQADCIGIIRRTAPLAEQARQLLPQQLELIYQQQWFKMLVPKQYGGLEMDLNQEVRLIEALAWADGSLGWVITLCTGAGWFGGFLDEQFAQQIFADRSVCLAGSGAPTGTATVTSNGYVINGTWKYASGALNTTHFTANCKILEDGQPVLNQHGEPLIQPFVFKKSEVNVIPAWAYIGMVSTGSHSFEVKNVVVPPCRAFKIDAAFTKVSRPLYIYPFHQLAEATLAANLSGMAIHFIDLCRDAFAEKNVSKNLKPEQQAELSSVLLSSISELNLVRESFYMCLDQSWSDFTIANRASQTQNLQNVSLASRALAKKARQIVDELYPYCGLDAARSHSELNRVWRDMHTASQHSLFTFSV
ncbi:alkylation response protein AidB-like acyl-CoA dehydrogenase [Mucilaginibacter gracilis]|uniref:Alkylation response protein AidB-like acyl-CoA dehydrogenase n=1 Tax=Mucilaginibacter gracilis TaxID=423350 RepID=A0A495IVS0_9SPHI|nr:acyl-CoA dehydrogenase family protein [Mucilaginibacter gracilis]RKR80820.1 alkylation response protein AidB-like acyl-CoA dehydrogenase [Mucilaginibacter gracilis]